MTSLEAVECYSSHHSETFEELLEWPYRRFIKAFGAWQRRNAVDEIEKKKNMHVQAMWGIIEWKESSDQKEAIEDIEKYYELLKDIVWDPAKMDRENKEMQEIEEADPFLKAGKRNVKKVVEPYLPNQESIEDTLNE
jgi:hypothetical protein